MTTGKQFTAGRYQLAADRMYDTTSHLWIQKGSDERARCGLDPLGAETSGDLVALSFEPVGSSVRRGGAFGSVEAAKFVGPLIAPVSGKVTAHNEEVLKDPGLVNREPLDHWLIEVELDQPGVELPMLLEDPEAIRKWIEQEIARYEQDGTLTQ